MCLFKQQLNLNPNIKIPSTNSLQQSSGLDDKSLKDIIEILNKRIENVKHLNEFSQVLQVDNISKSLRNRFIFKILFALL